MDKEIQDKWVKALRSGKYQQGRRALRTTDNKYCCLGVLCDLVASDEWSKSEDPDDPFYYHGPTSVMPDVRLCDDVGLDEDFSFDLAHANDAGSTFHEIADMIEAGPTPGTDD